MDIKNILIIENDTNWIQYMQNNFVETSIKFEFSSNMIHAMKLISSGSAYYHYVLINYSCINHGSLEELINTIKDVAPFLKIIFVLNNNNPYQIKEILSSDVKKYLIKPFSFDSLLTELSIQINRNNATNNDFFKNKDIMIDGISDLGNPNLMNNNVFDTSLGRDNMNLHKNNNIQNQNVNDPNNGFNPNDGFNPNMNGNPNMGGNPNGGFNPNMNGNPNMGGNINNGFNPNMGANPNMGGNINNGFNPNMSGNPNIGANPNSGFNPNMSGNPNMGANPNGGFNPNMGANPNSGFNSNMNGNPNNGFNPNGGFNPNMSGNPNGGFNPNMSGNPNGGFNPNMSGNPNGGFNPNMSGNPNGGFNPNMSGNPNGGFNPNMNGNPNNGFNPNGGFNPNMGGNPNNGYNPNNGFNPNMNGNPNSGQGVVRIPKNTTIAIHCPKGGVGKSSISKELAVAYAVSKVNGQNLKVCLIDMDVDYGDIAVMLEMKPNKSISDWARAIRSRQSENMEADLLFSFEEMKRFYLLEHKSGLFVLAAPTNLRDAALINENMVTVIVENLKKEFDVVIIDTGNNVKDFTITSMELADRVLMIGNTDIATVNELLTLKRTLEQIQFPINKIQLLMNEIKQSDETQAKEIASYLGLPIIGKLPRVSSIEKSNNNGEALIMSDQDNNFTMELKRVANTILPVIKKPNIQGKKGPKKKEKSSLFKKLFGK